MKKKLLIACSAFLSLTASQAIAQPWVYNSSGTTTGSGAIRTDASANEINLGNVFLRPYSGGVGTLDFRAGTNDANQTGWIELYCSGNKTTYGQNPAMFMFMNNNGFSAGDVEFRTNGTERFRIKKNGDINFANILLRPNSSGVATFDYKATGYTELYCNGTNGTNGANPAMFMFHTDLGTASAGDMEFRTNGQDRFRIKKSGEIKFGNTSFNPNNSGIATLDFGAASYTEIYSNGSSNGGANPSIFMFNTNYQPNGNNSMAGDIRFRTWGQDRLTINHDGVIDIHETNSNLATLKFKTDNYTELYGAEHGSGMFMGNTGATFDGGMTLFAYNNNSINNQNNRAFDLRTNDYNNAIGSGTPDERSHLTIRKNGKVVIGDGLNYQSIGNNSKVPDGYKLYVQEGILTEKIKVATIGGGNWADYVFADDYKLRDLDEVESFIKENKHLPEIPSAKEVEKDGLDLAQMDAKLLQKVEELTLYVIEQNKKLEAQQKEIQALKNKLN